MGSLASADSLGQLFRVPLVAFDIIFHPLQPPALVPGDLTFSNSMGQLTDRALLFRDFRPLVPRALLLFGDAFRFSVEGVFFACPFLRAGGPDNVFVGDDKSRFGDEKSRSGSDSESR